VHGSANARPELSGQPALTIAAWAPSAPSASVKALAPSRSAPDARDWGVDDGESHQAEAEQDRDDEHERDERESRAGRPPRAGPRASTSRSLLRRQFEQISDYALTRLALLVGHRRQESRGHGWQVIAYQSADRRGLISLRVTSYLAVVAGPECRR